MLLKDIMCSALLESGHIFMPDFESLLISQKDLKKIAQLALRDMNKYTARSFQSNIELTNGRWMVPPEMKNVYSVESLYPVGQGQDYHFNCEAGVFFGPNNSGCLAVTITGDWKITEVVDELGEAVLQDAPSSHNYCEQHNTPVCQEVQYEIVGYECSLHREDHDKLMSAYFMIALGRARAQFTLNNTIADPQGQALVEAGQELLRETREDLIDDSDQFLGLLDSPAVR